MIDEMDYKQGRVSTITEASRLFRFLLERGARVIVFCKVRYSLFPLPLPSLLLRSLYIFCDEMEDGLL